MDSETDSIFPILDRPTPLADRARDRVDNGDTPAKDEKVVGEVVGKKMAQIAQSDDEDEIDEILSDISSAASNAVSRELDVDEDQLDLDLIEDNIHTALRHRAEDILEDDVTEDSGGGEEEDDSPTFGS